jgi:hypothetical protein
MYYVNRMKGTASGVLVILACATGSLHAQDQREPDPELVRSFANMADSLSFDDVHAGWTCCRETVLLLRPRGTWALLKVVSQSVQWFEVPADSLAFRSVVARLVRLGFVVNWPTFPTTLYDDVPEATLTLRAPGQCHQTTVQEMEHENPPSGWKEARGILDSLAASDAWQRHAPPKWATPWPLDVTHRFPCRPEELDQK